MSSRIVVLLFVTLTLLGGVPVSSAAGPTLADFWTGAAFFERQTYSAPSTVHEVGPIARPDLGPNTIYMYYRTYVGQPSDGGAIGLAISSDGGSSFTLYNGGSPVVAPSPGGCDLDSMYAVSPSVVKVGFTFYLVYEGRSRQPSCGTEGDIMLATSTDGITWTKQGRIIAHGGGWESRNIGTPFIGLFNNKFYVFYHGFDGTRIKVGYASGTDIYALTKYSGNPVMDVGKGRYSWDSYVNSHVSVVQEGSYYYMAYEGSQNPYCSGGSWGWGVARSSNLNSWVKFIYNPIRHTYAGGCGNDLPTLFKFNGWTYVYQREAGQRNRLVSGGDPYLYVWQAESRCNTYHQVGRVDGTGFSANTAQDSPGYLCYGPYVTLPAGNYDITLVEQVDVISAPCHLLVTHDIYDATVGIVLKARDIYRCPDFVQAWLYQGFNMQFPATANRLYEFRTWWYDYAYIRQDMAFARRL